MTQRKTDPGKGFLRGQVILIYLRVQSHMRTVYFMNHYFCANIMQFKFNLLQTEQVDSQLTSVLSHDFIARFCFLCKHPPCTRWLVASLLIQVNTVHTWFYPLCKQMQTSRILTNLKWASAVIAAILAQSVIFPSLSNTCKSTFTDQT